MIKEADLAQFTGSTNLFTHWLKILSYTEGVKFLASKTNSFWLIDAIASHQNRSLLLKHPELKEFQLWQLEVKTDKTATLTCRTDSDCKPVVTQEIEFTNFPLTQIKLYVCQKVLMLPSEY
jgi:hypothetical protein